MNPFGKELARYADCGVRAGVAVRRGDVLSVVTPYAHRELAIALAEAAYRAGVRVVEVHYDDPRAQAARIRYGSEASLGELPPWARDRYHRLIADDAGYVVSIGESDPGVFDGLPPERVARELQRPAQELKTFVKAVLGGNVRWAGCAWPTAYWSKQVYPGLDEAKARRRLARELLEFCRLGRRDPEGIEGWTEHARTLERRAAKLTRLRLERLRLRGPGTDLDVRLAPGTIWRGGRESARRRMTSPNIPTEEVFTSPHAGATEGGFSCSMPLSFQGRLIEGIRGEFRRGRLVRLEAKRDDDRDFLAAFLDSEPNTRRLGEVALVDATSRIGRKQRVYFNTLLDENAAAHFAFGAGFGNTREEGGRGVNRASFHLDVMIGTPDFEATGALGRRQVPLIAGGLWQI